MAGQLNQDVDSCIEFIELLSRNRPDFGDRFLRGNKTPSRGYELLDLSNAVGSTSSHRVRIGCALFFSFLRACIFATGGIQFDHVSKERRSVSCTKLLLLYVGQLSRAREPYLPQPVYAIHIWRVPPGSS